jgi:hypothetical protein
MIKGEPGAGEALRQYVFIGAKIISRHMVIIQNQYPANGDFL